jgi:pSer/pThr/pTyr-binding forkhead associated (FHA) protein
MVRLDSRSVSTDHAMIEFVPDGPDGGVRAILHDLNSRNGTLVNDRRLRNASCALADGDSLRFGYDDAGALVFNLAARSLERSRTAPSTATPRGEERSRVQPRPSSAAEPGYGVLPSSPAPRHFDRSAHELSIAATRARRPAGTSSPLDASRSLGTFVQRATAAEQGRLSPERRPAAGVASHRRARQQRQRRQLTQRQGGVARYIELEELPLGARTQAELSRARVEERARAKEVNEEKRRAAVAQQRETRAAGVRNVARERESAADIIFGGADVDGAASEARVEVASARDASGTTPPHAKTTPRRDATDPADAPLFASDALTVQTRLPAPSERVNRGAQAAAQFELILTASQQAMEAGRSTKLRVDEDGAEPSRYELPMQRDGWPIEISTATVERQRRLEEAGVAPRGAISTLGGGAATTPLAAAERELGDAFGGLLDGAANDDDLGANIGGATRRKRAASKVDRSAPAGPAEFDVDGNAFEGKSADELWGDAAAEEIELRAMRAELTASKANLEGRRRAGARERMELRYDTAMRHSQKAETTARKAARSAATYAEIASAAVECALLRDEAGDAERERERQTRLALGKSVTFEDGGSADATGQLTQSPGGTLATQNSAFARIGKEAFFQAIRHASAAEAVAVAASAAAAARLAAALAQVSADEASTLLNLDEKIESAAQASLQMRAAAADGQRREAGSRARALDEHVLEEAKVHAVAANKVLVNRKELQRALRDSSDAAAAVEEKEAALHAATGIATEAELEEHRAQLRTLRTQLGAARETVGTARQQLRINSVEEQRAEERVEGLQSAAHAAREEEIRAGIEAAKCAELLAGDMRETIDVQRANATSRAEWLARKRNWVGGEGAGEGAESGAEGGVGARGALFNPEDIPYLTEDEKLREIFDAFDHDQGGTICVGELGAVLEALGMNPTPQRLKQMIAKVDNDSDGEISYSEFRTMLGRKNDKQVQLDDADLASGRQRRWRQLVRDGMSNGELDGALAQVKAEIVREDLLERKRKQERAEKVAEAEDAMRAAVR